MHVYNLVDRQGRTFQMSEHDLYGRRGIGRIDQCRLNEMLPAKFTLTTNGSAQREFHAVSGTVLNFPNCKTMDDVLREVARNMSGN